MSEHFWKRKPFWDHSEIAFVCLTAVFGSFTAVSEQSYKRIPASFTVFFAMLTAFAKWKAKTIEGVEKNKKIAEEQLLQDEHRDAITRLKQESEVFRQKYDASIRHVMIAVLDDFHSKYFRRDARTEDRYKHRATLFVCADFERNSVPERRLAIFARSGIHKESTCSWPIDDNDPEKCRGVAGQIWFHGVGRVRTAACDWPRDGNTAQKIAYAESLGMTVDEAEALNVKSRVFTGAQIMVRGQKWGVLLLDSLKEIRSLTPLTKSSFSLSM